MNIRWGIFFRTVIFAGLVLFMGMGDLNDGLLKKGLSSSLNTKENEAGATKDSLSDIFAVGQKIKKLWNTFAFPVLQAYLINEIAKNDPNNYRPAQVYTEFKPLVAGKSWEGTFISRRETKIKDALENLLGGYIPSNAIPRIACSCSGGGYRAMIMTTGFMHALEDMRMLDAIMYSVGLSGGTFFIGPYTLMQPTESGKPAFTIAQFAERLREKIRRNLFRPEPWSWPLSKQREYFKRLSTDCVFPKIVFSQPISTIDVSGSALAEVLLADFGNERQLQRLSNQWFHAQNGHCPWPMYTAISMTKNQLNQASYNWYEFSPEEIRNLETNFAIPAFAFGRTFQDGKSTNLIDAKIGSRYAPEQSFGYLMGIFGSAISFSINDLKRIQDSTPIDPADDKTVDEAEELAQQGKFTGIWQMIDNKLKLGMLQEAVTKRALSDIADSKVGKQRLFGAAQVRNPFKGYEQASDWLKNREFITFVDGGLAYNTPLLPLYRTDRNVNLILMCDASSDADTRNELKKAMDDVKRVHGISYTKDESMSDDSMLVFRPSQPHEPILVYFNFYPTPEMLQKVAEHPELGSLMAENDLAHFDTLKCINEEACGTFNFNYTEKDFNRLMNAVRVVVRMHEDVLKKLLIEVVHHKEEDVGFGG